MFLVFGFVLLAPPAISPWDTVRMSVGGWCWGTAGVSHSLGHQHPMAEHWFECQLFCLWSSSLPSHLGRQGKMTPSAWTPATRVGDPGELQAPSSHSARHGCCSRSGSEPVYEGCLSVCPSVLRALPFEYLFLEIIIVRCLLRLHCVTGTVPSSYPHDLTCCLEQGNRADANTAIIYTQEDRGSLWWSYSSCPEENSNSPLCGVNTWKKKSS